MNQYYDDFIKIPSFLSSSLEKNINIPATLCDMQCQGQCVNGEGGCEQCGQSCSQSCGQSTTPTTVTCTKQVRLYNYNHTQLLDRYTAGSEELYPGYDFTPSAHQPAIPAGYSLYSITYNNKDVTTGTMTCPSSNFTLIFNYRKDEVSHLWINNGSQWVQVIPYINNGSKWVEYKAYLNNGSKWI